MLKRVHFDRKVLPFLLVAPQIIVTLVFFIWPAAQALYQSVLREDPFGLKTSFIWFENFERLLDGIAGENGAAPPESVERGGALLEELRRAVQYGVGKLTC